MSIVNTPLPIDLPHLLAEQRPRIVGLCQYLTGDPDVAEDLAQEVLVEAWRHVDQLRDPHAFAPWLSGIARNVSARWLRKHGRMRAAIDPLDPDQAADLADPFRWEIELERQELATLLDRALALLPPETRSVLVEKYVAERSLAEIGDALRLSENAVAVRLHRGRLALRQILTHDLRDEAAAFGLTADTDGWQETRIWCSGCGAHRLMGMFSDDEFILRCPVCSIEPDAFHSQSQTHPILTGVKGFKPALNRFAAWMDQHFQAAITHGATTCQRCGKVATLRMGMPDHAPPSVRQQRGIHTPCDHCGSSSYTTLDGVALCLPQGRRFFRDHPRITTLPQYSVEAKGRPAIVVHFASVEQDATFGVVFDRDTYQVLAVDGDDHA